MSLITPVNGVSNCLGNNWIIVYRGNELRVSGFVEGRTSQKGPIECFDNEVDYNARMIELGFEY